MLNTYRQETQENPDNIHIYNLAWEIQPNDVKLCFSLANTLEKKGEINQGINTEKKVLWIKPTHSEVALKLETLLNIQKNIYHLQVNQLFPL